MIDLHSHVLHGLDDGAATLAEAVEICELAAADGIEVLAATPHVRASDYPTTADAMERALAEVQAAVAGRIQVVPGGELDLAELGRPADELARFGLGGSSWLLVETPYVGWPLDLADRLFRLRVHGFRALLAHPERNAEVQARPELLEPLVEGGTLVHLTAASVDGRLGSRAKRCAHGLIEAGLAHVIASDAHTPGIRAAGMSAAAAEVGDEALARWLTLDVPRALLEERPLPPRPERPRRRWPFRR